MNSSSGKSVLLEAMGIPQWVSRAADVKRSPAIAKAPATEVPLVGKTQLGKTPDITVTGNTASGWLWLIGGAATESELRFLADIQRAVNCRGGGLLARVDAESVNSLPLAAVIEAELITHLVIFGNRQFQEVMSTGLTMTSLVKVETLPLSELEKSPAAKRQLWSELKKLLS